MRLLQRSRRAPRAKTIRPAEPYLLAGADEARRLSHNYIGTEHILSVLARDRDGSATRLLAQLGVTAEAVERALACWLQDGSPAAKIDPHQAADAPLGDEHVLLGMLNVPDSVAARVLAELGVTPEEAHAVADAEW